MTLKTIDILNARSSDDGWFIMSEAASIDKQMHALDYDRALGDLLELDDTIKASVQRLKELGQLEETLVLVTADHGHGFDVMGSVDTQYLNAQSDDRAKRNAVGIYENAGLSQYINGDSSNEENNNGGGSEMIFSEGAHFPTNWDPRYTLFQGMMANPDRRENYQVHKDGPRVPAINITEDDDYYANPEDASNGFLINGTLPTSMPVGVHSLTDVPVFAMGPCQELFGGVYSSVDVFFGMAECLGLGRDLESADIRESDAETDLESVSEIELEAESEAEEEGESEQEDLESIVTTAS